MDIKALDNFFNYEPFIDQEPQIIVDGIIQQAEKYLPAEQIAGIQKAYEFARNAHGTQIRLSKEEYIVHPLKATEFLMEIRPDIATIQTCILHDVIEDTTTTQKDIEKEF
jgi:GTP pyrophosphokinase